MDKWDKYVRAEAELERTSDSIKKLYNALRERKDYSVKDLKEVLTELIEKRIEVKKILGYNHQSELKMLEDIAGMEKNYQ